MEPAIIAVIGAVVGVILTNGIKLFLDARARAERVRDIQTALRAEIRSQRRTLEVFHDEERLDDTVAQILADQIYLPFVPREAGPFVFDALVRDIHVLPGRVIDPIVLYYRQWRAVSALTEDMRTTQYAALSQDRKAALYEDYFAMGVYAVELATDAVDAINRSLRNIGEN